jgi:5-methyltetrahydropteroyltriglutamate--homocysteine methyltransferase
MSVSVPPFKAEVVGSLLRPAAIHDARSGGRSADEVWSVEARAIEEAIAMQRDVGLKVCTDGEMHRRHWFMDFIERIDGVGFEGGLPTRFHNEGGDIEFAPPRVVVKGKLKRSQPLSVHHFAALKPLGRPGRADRETTDPIADHSAFQGRPRRNRPRRLSRHG